MSINLGATNFISWNMWSCLLYKLWPYCELLERSRKKSRKYFEDIIIDLNQEVWMNEKIAPDAATSHYVDAPRLLSRIISVIILCSIISQKYRKMIAFCSSLFSEKKNSTSTIYLVERRNFCGFHTGTMGQIIHHLTLFKDVGTWSTQIQGLNVDG